MELHHSATIIIAEVIHLFIYAALKMSLEGGLEEVDEFLRSLAFSVSSAAMRSSSRRITAMSSAFVHASNAFMYSIIKRRGGFAPEWNRKPVNGYLYFLTDA